jgi:hypothetical protein
MLTCLMGIGLSHLPEECLVVPADLLQHDDVGAGLGEKGFDLLDVDVALAPHVERRHAQESFGILRGSRRSSRQVGDQHGERDRQKRAGRHDQHAAAQRKAQGEQNDEATGQQEKAVVHDVEGRIGIRKPPGDKRCRREQAAGNDGGVKHLRVRHENIVLEMTFRGSAIVWTD